MKKKQLFIFILLTIVYSLILLNIEFKFTDEVWCYGYCKLVADGYVLYKEISAVQTPLFFLFGSLFSHDLMVFRIFGGAMSAGLMTIISYICDKNKVDTALSSILLIILSTLLLPTMDANYNLLLIIAVIGVYYVSMNFIKKMNSINAFALGISLSLALLVKQNVPDILIIFFTTLLVILMFRKRISIKDFALYALGGLLPVAIFLIYTLVTQSFFSFLDFTILSMGSFSKFSLHYDKTPEIIVISIIITAFIIINTIRHKKYSLESLVLIAFSICSYLLVFPLADAYHSKLLLIFNIVLIIPWLKAIKLKSKKINNVIITSLILLFIVLSFDTISFEGNDKTRSNIFPYKGLIINKELEKDIYEVSSFIKEKESLGLDVAVIDIDAYMYCLAAEDSNYFLDTLNVFESKMVTLESVIREIEKKDIILFNPKSPYLMLAGVKEYVNDHYVATESIGTMKLMKRIK